MKVQHLLPALVASLLAACSAAPEGDASGFDSRAEDRAAIENLLWRYVRALDSFDADAYAAVFTEDGQFGTGDGATRGREALHKMVADLAAGRTEDSAPMHHVIANSWLEFIDEDNARFHSYWMTVFGASGETPVRVAAVGRGIDDLVRTDDGWLIQLRDVQPQD